MTSSDTRRYTPTGTPTNAASIEYTILSTFVKFSVGVSVTEIRGIQNVK